MLKFLEWHCEVELTVVMEMLYRSAMFSPDIQAKCGYLELETWLALIDEANAF